MTNDDYYMNHVYMSEYWLWQHMVKDFSKHNNPRWIKQLKDEKKHAGMTRGALKKSIPESDIVNDVAISIEKAMFEDLGGIDVDNVPKEHLTIVDQPNGITYYNIPTDQNWEYLDEFELASPVVFDTIVPHEVVPCPNSTNHRISCSIGFNKDLLLSKSFDAWDKF